MLGEKLWECPFLGYVNFTCFGCEERDCFPRVFISHLPTAYSPSSPRPLQSLLESTTWPRGCKASEKSLRGLPMYLALQCPHADYCALPTWNVLPCPWHTTRPTFPPISRLTRTIAFNSWRILIHLTGKKKASYTHKTKENRCLKSASKSLVTLCWANCFEVIIVNETKWFQSYLLTFKKVSILFLVTKGQYIV